MELENLTNNELIIRAAFFIAAFAAFAIWELVSPRRVQNYSKAVRWLNNLSLTLINTLISRFLLPIIAVTAALISQQQNLGLLNKVDLPAGIELLIALLLLDLALYLQHLVFHHVDFLWRLHRMHHADLDIDVTTGIRFHPLEIILSALIKVVVVFMLGTSVAAVIIFEIILNATSLFNHANIYLPKRLDQISS